MVFNAGAIASEVEPSDDRGEPGIQTPGGSRVQLLLTTGRVSRQRTPTVAALQLKIKN